MTITAIVQMRNSSGALNYNDVTEMERSQSVEIYSESIIAYFEKV